MRSLIFVIAVWLLIIKAVCSRRTVDGQGRGGARPLWKALIPCRAEGSKASAVPNQPKRVQRTREEAAAERLTQASRRACTYQAAYSKGRPDRIGRRADYEPGVPSGMVRMKCAYCGAESFVPAGSHEHYHCYFCWEKI